jgi:hypothetical protein
VGAGALATVIWWRPTYPERAYKAWTWRKPFTLNDDLVVRFFQPANFPQPSNDRDHCSW